jgi:2-oxoglutarate dehydrogenase E2 component (dihydrolipoamide succinyltransferase)
MSLLRLKIAERLKQAQNTAAMLTTFNEVDLSKVQELRKQYKDKFKSKYGVGLGYMSFFSRAAALALKDFEAVNASIDGSDIVYHDYVHMGIAVGTDRGLVVPVLRNTDKMSFAQIEQAIVEAANKAKSGKLGIAEMSGGTFTITNGGTYGSMLSTPILNPPQSAILGMHNIIERPVAVDGKIEIRPMMYLAVSYDHRIIDGKEAVSFLVAIKKRLENPEELGLEFKKEI